MKMSDIKKRDVMSYDDFLKAYITVTKPVATKEGENPDPGAHKIKAEGLYSRNDANVYKAAGIPYDEKTANSSNFANAKTVDIYDEKAPGKDDAKTKLGKDEFTDPKQESEQEKAAKDAKKIVGNFSGGSIKEGKDNFPLTKTLGLYSTIVSKYGLSEVLASNVKMILNEWENGGPFKVDDYLVLFRVIAAIAAITSKSEQEIEKLFKDEFL